MCGIVGILSPRPIPDSRSVIAGMNATLDHRGPDQDGLFVDAKGTVALGHKRLSILDLSAGRQPMTDHEGLFTVVFNGEIYNHKEIKAELIAKGHPISSRSDTETLLYAFKEYGPGCVDRLRGMFAFAVHSRRDGSIFVARDRLGIKPLYYGMFDGAVLFASECKALLAYPGFPRDIDHQALSDYLSFLYVPAPKSIYRRIRKLPAGHWMRISADGSVTMRKYWDLDFPRDGEADAVSFKTAKREVAEVLEESVRIHMEADVPLGAFLSGGLDSTAVVAMMAKNSVQPILTNTIGFRESDLNEAESARKTSGHFRTEHHEFTVHPEASSVLKDLSWFYDEPFADSSMIPTYYVCKMARGNVTVALSGDGGDENFAGYRRYYYDWLENRIRGRVPAAIRRPLFGALAAAYPKADWLPQPLRAKTMLQSLSRCPLEGYFRTMSHFLPETKRLVLSGDLQRDLAGYDSMSVFEAHWGNCASSHPLSKIQYLDAKTYLVDDILTKVDRASMAVSLEVRVPLLDHRFMEHAAKLPPDLKLRGKTGKYILRESMRDYLPVETFDRPKTGFHIPIDGWFRAELKDFAHATLFDKGGLLTEGLLNKVYLERLWKEHQSKLWDHSLPLFAIMNLSLWNDRFKAAAALPAGPAMAAWKSG